MPSASKADDRERYDLGPLLHGVLLNTVDALVVVLDRNARIVLFNRACQQAAGYAAEEVQGRVIWEFLLTPEELPGVKAVFSSLSAGQFPNRHENDWIAKDGGRRRIRWSNTAMTGDDGQVRYVVGTGIDVTDLERAQETMTRSDSRMRAILDTAIDAILTIDERGTISSVNPATERLFGYASAEMIGQNVKILMPSPYHEQHDGYLDNYKRTGERKIIGLGREVVGKRKDGSTFPLYISVGESSLKDERLFVGILHDLTEMKKKEAELVLSRSLAAIGESAAAIAHEIKNPLAAISAPLQIFEDGLPADDPRKEILHEVQGQVKRLDGTIRQLLLLAKPWTPRKEPCELGAVVRRVIELTKDQELFREVRIIPEGPTSVTASVDISHFEQILWNLVLNAGQALSGKGEIRIGLSETREEVGVSVCDNGPGMTAEVLAKISQPFFTTKRGGTGLGMSICRKIMDAHGGRMEITSESGSGTTVALSFPRIG